MLRDRRYVAWLEDLCRVRKVDGPRVIVKTGRHRAQSITLIENAKAVIVKKLKYVYKE